MSTDVYTLLIVESPVIAGIIQNQCPASVYVIATGGYCWKPVYDAKTNQLKAIADPDKKEIRNELKEQAKWANSIIIATDSDPSGDFIAWSVFRYLKKPGIKRTRLHNLSRPGIEAMLNDAAETDFQQLETRLRNRFLIRNVWNSTPYLPEFELAAIVAVFGFINRFTHFSDNGKRLFQSTEQLRLRFDDWLSLEKTTTESCYRLERPLSTFDLLERLVQDNICPNFTQAQKLLQELFMEQLQYSGQSIISYPRTAAKAFYSETWKRIKQDLLKTESQNQLKPSFMQETADPEAPHESIHPLSIDLHPDEVIPELSSSSGKLYSIIHEATLSALRMPVAVPTPYRNELQAGTHFYPISNDISDQKISVSPCFTVADFCISLYNLGALSLGKSGEKLDRWISKNWITVQHKIVTPQPAVLAHINQSETWFKRLNMLKRSANEPSLSGETVTGIISS